MSQYPRPGSPYCAPTAAGGTAPLPMAAGRATLASSTTYYWLLGGESAPLESVHIRWDAVLNAIFTVEDCNMPIGDVADLSTTAGDWIPENPTTAYVGIVASSCTVSNLTITVALTTAGGAMINFGNSGARRLRLKCVVTTGGVVTVAAHGKA